MYVVPLSRPSAVVSTADASYGLTEWEKGEWRQLRRSRNECLTVRVYAWRDEAHKQEERVGLTAKLEIPHYEFSHAGHSVSTNLAVDDVRVKLFGHDSQTPGVGSSCRSFVHARTYMEGCRSSLSRTCFTPCTLLRFRPRHTNTAIRVFDPPVTRELQCSVGTMMRRSDCAGVDVPQHSEEAQKRSIAELRE